MERRKASPNIFLNAAAKDVSDQNCDRTQISKIGRLPFGPAPSESESEYMKRFGKVNNDNDTDTYCNDEMEQRGGGSRQRCGENLMDAKPILLVSSLFYSAASSQASSIATYTLYFQ
jgi:hypothetical protein